MPQLPAPAAAPARAGHAEVHEEALARHSESLLRGGAYGVFRIRVKQPGMGGAGKYGGYEGVCPFHKLSAKSGCKRFVTVKGDGKSFKKDALRQLSASCRGRLAAGCHAPCA